MTIIIDKSNSKNTSSILKEKLNKTSKPGNLKKHFAELKRNLDGLAYQLVNRENED